MTNLLHMWLPLMRLSALDRHVLCRFAFGTVEQALDVDLADLLVENRAHIIALAPSPADAH